MNAFLHSVKKGSISQEKAQDVSRTIGRLIFDLFDLDYCEYKASLILQEISNKTKRSSFEELLNTLDTENAVRTFEEQEVVSLIQRIDFKDIDDEIIRNSVKIIAQHFDVVMCYAFSGLNNLPRNIKHSICTEFLSLMQRDMRWPEEIMEEISSSIIDIILSNEEELTEDVDNTMSFGGGK